MIKIHTGKKIGSIKWYSSGNKGIKKVKGYTNGEWVDIWSNPHSSSMEVIFTFYPYMTSLAFTNAETNESYSLNEKYGVGNLATVYRENGFKLYKETLPFPEGSVILAEAMVGGAGPNGYDDYYVSFILRDTKTDWDAFPIPPLSSEFKRPRHLSAIRDLPFWQELNLHKNSAELATFIING